MDAPIHGIHARIRRMRARIGGLRARIASIFPLLSPGLVRIRKNNGSDREEFGLPLSIPR
jgi:hypothetical protein